jgi:hypothetical protein
MKTEVGMIRRLVMLPGMDFKVSRNDPHKPSPSSSAN